MGLGNVDTDRTSRQNREEFHDENQQEGRQNIGMPLYAPLNIEALSTAHHNNLFFLCLNWHWCIALSILAITVFAILIVVATATTTPPNSPSGSSEQPKPTFCGCSSCTQDVWDSAASDSTSNYSCGSRITWLQTDGGYTSEQAACLRVASVEFPNGPCGPACNPVLCVPESEVSKDSTNKTNNPTLCDAANNVSTSSTPEYHANKVSDPNPNHLVWQDEFETDGLPDPQKWKYDIGDGCDKGTCGWGNNELEYYTNNITNAYVSNGMLNIQAVKERVESSQYTSARLVSANLGDWTYGRICVRANLAQCTAKGAWAAIWMLPTNWAYGDWPDSGEIDIMEHVGFDSGNFHGTVHTKAYNGMIGTQVGSNLHVSVYDWHIFEIIWEVDKIQFVLDGSVYFEFAQDSNPTTAKWPFDKDFHLVLNVAVGGNWGGMQGVDAAAFGGTGQTMQIDWVRVYSS